MSELVLRSTTYEVSPSIAGGKAAKANAHRETVYECSKRAVDLIATGLGLLFLSPFFVLLAVIIKLDSQGPVLFPQTRVGRRGELFRCWKFRSMIIDADKRKRELTDKNEMAGGTTFKIRQDPRITRVGRFIRKASIDELPQLWNVFVGDMSLVGPRPPLPQEVAKYSAHERKRLAIKPGITCIWQVSGRSDISFCDQVRLDIEYINKRSLRMDLLILLKTVPAVLFARGAY
jgi:lipopolysaccharide/colanic/teichoic acid biosynthesis glycosyltransferase